MYLVAESSITGSRTGNQTRQGKIHKEQQVRPRPVRSVSGRRAQSPNKVKTLQDKEVAKRVVEESARVHRAQAKQRTSHKIGGVGVMKTKSVVINNLWFKR